MLVNGKMFNFHAGTYSDGDKEQSLRSGWVWLRKGLNE